MLKIIFLTDIIERFEISKLTESIFSNDLYYIIETILTDLFLVFIVYFFLTFRKYGFFYFFKKPFFFVLKANLGEKFNDTHFTNTMSIFFYFLFLFVVTQNISGIFPVNVALTSYIILPAHISFTTFIATFFIALEENKFKFLEGFLPAGTPAFISPFLVVIEAISYFIRLISLAVRLFINILAGHILLDIFSHYLQLFFMNLLVTFTAFIILYILSFAMFIMEIGACFLQAIVLVSLVAIYVDHSLTFTKH